MRIGIRAEGASQLASRLRGRGVKLKRMPGVPRIADVDAFIEAMHGKRLNDKKRNFDTALMRARKKA